MHTMGIEIFKCENLQRNIIVMEIILCMNFYMKLHLKHEDDFIILPWSGTMSRNVKLKIH